MKQLIVTNEDRMIKLWFDVESRYETTAFLVAGKTARCGLMFLSCNFTKKRPSKIFKIEKFNRQAIYKNGLILTK